ncbi:MAG: NYN domain-containing protein [Thermoplasmata archaeon]|nr:MAG: NYN domain-containing protein [Thermoplasmata archaeon]
MDRAVVLIDGGYLAKVLDSDFNRAKVDFLKLSEELCKGSDRLRTYYYNCMPYQHDPPTDEERRRFSAMDRFIYTLRKLPRFEVRLGKLGRIGGEFVQKRVDILMAVDLVRMSWGRQIGKAIMVTGDSDFVPAIEAAKDAGVLVQLYYSRSAIHDELLMAVDDCFEITKELIESCKI